MAILFGVALSFTPSQGWWSTFYFGAGFFLCAITTELTIFRKNYGEDCIWTKVYDWAGDKLSVDPDFIYSFRFIHNDDSLIVEIELKDSTVKEITLTPKEAVRFFVDVLREEIPS